MQWLHRFSIPIAAIAPKEPPTPICFRGIDEA